ncbi:MAG: zf-HC2 domain-containing protein [Candidatus Riflebacteria bacterium]|nr:zf-HC2 domain-containing protein [Candidatus Riflebacteria bacterium]
MDCRSFREKISSFIDGDLTSERDAFEAHAKTCSGCSKELDKYNKLLKNYKSFYVDFDPGKPSQFKFPESQQVSAPSDFLRDIISWFNAGMGNILVPALALLLVVAVFTKFSFDKTSLIRVSDSVYAKIISGNLQKIDSDHVETEIFKASENTSVEMTKNVNFMVCRGTVLNFSDSGIKIHEGIAKLLIRSETLNSEKKVFCVSTPVMEIIVTGTEFEVLASKDASLLSLTNGKVSVKCGTFTASINSGEILVCNSNYQTGLIKIDERLKNIISEANFQDMGKIVQPILDRIESEKIIPVASDLQNTVASNSLSLHNEAAAASISVAIPVHVNASSTNAIGSDVFAASDSVLIHDSDANIASVASTTVDLIKTPVDSETLSTGSEDIHNPEEVFGQ